MSRYFEASKQKEETNRKVPKKIKLKRNEDEDISEDVAVESDDIFPGSAPLSTEKQRKYQRGKRLDAHGVKTKLRKSEIIKIDKKIRQSTKQAARAELLLPEEQGFLEADANDDTFRICQQDIADAVDITSATKFFSLSLTDFGPYHMNYSRDGRHLLLGGQRGHVAAMDWVTKKLLCEMNVMESVHDLCWLHVPTMYAVAQKEWVFIYDTEGIELHCVKKLPRVLKMEFLPYHFLLTCSNDKGYLYWLDVSVGKMVTETYTNAGRLNVLRQNPYNGVILTGHSNGTVSMWSPNVNTPLVRMLCHPHPIRAVAVDSRGQYMATASIDRKLKIWDMRTYKCLQSYGLSSAAGFLDFSQQGCLAAGLGNIVEVYKNCVTETVRSTYVRHKVSATVADLQFCPYEDVLGISHYRGFTSILVPGAGEPNFDAFESNPFMTKSQRREMEVKGLLEKIQPELITLDPSHLGQINVPTLKEKLESKKALLYVKPQKINFEPQKKTKGRSKSARSFKRKKAVMESKKREFIKEFASSRRSRPVNEPITATRDVLSRFKAKTQK